MPDAKRQFFSQNKVEFIENNGFEITDCDIDARTLTMNGFFGNNPQANTVLTRIDPRWVNLQFYI